MTFATSSGARRIKSALVLFSICCLCASFGLADNSDGHYDACKDVDLSQPGCLPPSDFLTGLHSAQDIANGVKLLQGVAELYKKNLQTNIAYYQGIKSCLATPSPSCKDTVAKFRAELQTSYVTLRKELALAGRPHLTQSASVSPNPRAHINFRLRSVSSLPNPVGTDKLSPKEYQQAEVDLKADQEKIAKIFKKKMKALSAKGHVVPDHAQHSELLGLYRKMESEHSANYLGELTLHPHLMYLPPAPKGAHTWTDAQVESGITKLVDAAKKEIKRTDAAVAEGRIEFNRYNLEATVRGYFRNEAQLLDYALYPDLVNEVLSKNKNLCGVAVVLAKREKTMDYQNLAIEYSVEYLAAYGAGDLVPLIRAIAVGGIGIGEIMVVTTQAAMGGGTLQDAKGLINPGTVPAEVMGESGLPSPVDQDQNGSDASPDD